MVLAQTQADFQGANRMLHFLSSNSGMAIQRTEFEAKETRPWQSSCPASKLFPNKASDSNRSQAEAPRQVERDGAEDNAYSKTTDEVALFRRVRIHRLSLISLVAVGRDMKSKWPASILDEEELRALKNSLINFEEFKTRNRS